MATILVNYGVPMEGFASLAPHAVVAPPPLAAFSRRELMEHMRDADAVVACKAVDGEHIKAAERLKLIVCYGAGYDAIDMDAATERGVMVCNTPDCVTAPTAELAIALITALARRVPELDRLARAQNDAAFGLGRRMGISLEGATLGVVGMGRIGARVADFGRLMGMRVLYASRSPKPERDALGDARAPLDALLREADIVSLHCPLTPDTNGLISLERLALMKPTAYLVNTARGAVVDEAAMIDALRSGRLAGAALDVFTREPDIDERLRALPNVILTPHVGSNTRQARHIMAQAASERILAMLDGRVPANLLNPEALR